MKALLHIKSQRLFGVMKKNTPTREDMKHTLREGKRGTKKRKKEPTPTRNPSGN